MTTFLFPRDCPPHDCTICADTEVCVLGVASEENPCPSVTCSAELAGTDLPPNPSSGGGSSAGAIAGGVVGGVAAAAIFSFLVWFFCFSKRAQRIREEKEWLPVVGQDHITSGTTLQGSGDEGGGGGTGRDPRDRQSFASIASSAFSRASNVIPIAYIPGVTSRGQGSSNGGSIISSSTHTDTPWEYQFTPEELLRQSRQSTIYGIRDSVSTEAYRESQAYVSSAMMTAIQARPVLVNVKDGHATDQGSRASTIRQSFASGTSDASVYEVSSAERVNARSIQYKKAQRVGLQSTYISEEGEESAACELGEISATVPIGLDGPIGGRCLTDDNQETTGEAEKKPQIPPIPSLSDLTNSDANTDLPDIRTSSLGTLDIPVHFIAADDEEGSPFDDKFRL